MIEKIRCWIYAGGGNSESGIILDIIKNKSYKQMLNLTGPYFKL